MNTNTGHLINMEPESLKRVFGEIPTNEQLVTKGYEPVPKELAVAAEKKLTGKDEAYVSLTSGGKLAKWAAKQRKAKRKAQKVARRNNR